MVGRLVVDLYGHPAAIFAGHAGAPGNHRPALPRHGHRQNSNSGPGRNKALVVGRLVVDLYGHPAAIALQSKVRIAAVLVNVVEMVLGVEIPGLFRAERLAEQLDEQVLRNTAGIIASDGKTCTVEVLSDSRCLQMLDAKLTEELEEYQESRSLEELHRNTAGGRVPDSHGRSLISL